MELNITDKYNVNRFIFPCYYHPENEYERSLEIYFNKFYHRTMHGFTLNLEQFIISLGLIYYDLGNRILIPLPKNFQQIYFPAGLFYDVKKSKNVSLAYTSKISNIPDMSHEDLLDSLSEHINVDDLEYYWIPEINTVWLNRKLNCIRIILSRAGQEFICHVS